MAVELLIGPAASGKTQYCIDRIKQVRAQHALAPIWVLVPDAHKARYFKRRLAAPDGAIGVRVGTFRNLYTELLERSGRFVPALTDALEHRLLQETAAQLATQGQLPHYRPIHDKPGFISAIIDVFWELRSALVTAEQFEQQTAQLGDPPRELAKLYRAYYARLDAMGWTDEQGLAWLALDLLKKDKNAASWLPLVIADGAISYMPSRVQFMKQLSAQAGELLVTVGGERGSTRNVHARTSKLIATLERELSPRITTSAQPSRLPGDVAHIAVHVFDHAALPERTPQTAFLMEARSQAEEAREALRWLKARIVHDQVAPDQCAVFVSEFGTYLPLLRAAADEFGLRLSFTQREPLSLSPLADAVLRLVGLPGQKFAARQLLIVLNSPYLHAEFDARLLDDLDHVSRFASITGGKDEWDAAWALLASPLPEDLAASDDERARDKTIQDVDWRALQPRMDAFWRIFDDISRPRPYAEWVGWLQDVLHALDFAQGVTDKRDLAAMETLNVALNALELGEYVFQAVPVSYDQFVLALRSGVQGTGVAEPWEPGVGQIHVGRISEVPAMRYDAVVLVGFSEGVFPGIRRADPFLGEDLRTVLGLESRVDGDQTGIFYQALTRCEKHLLITRPYLEKKGEHWEPSPYWDAISRLFTKEAISKADRATVLSQSQAASPQEVVFRAVQMNGLRYPQDAALASRVEDVELGGKVVHARRALTPQGAFEGEVPGLSAQMQSKYGAAFGWSASKLESYLNCAFAFFVGYVLELEPLEPPEPGLTVTQIGSVQHRVLEMVFRRAPIGASAETVLALVEPCAREVFGISPQKDGFRPSSLWGVEQEQMIAKLKKSVKALLEISEGWRPLALEQRFGFDGAAPLLLETGTGTMRFHGVIDRVDINEQKELRIIDYKLGSSHLGQKDLEIGRRIQLPLYALAAQQVLQLGIVVDGFYWHVNGAKAGALSLAEFGPKGAEGPQAAYSALVEHAGKTLGRMYAGQFKPEPSDKTCPDYCPAAQWCWRYKRQSRRG